jgi:hypothetical protein
LYKLNVQAGARRPLAFAEYPGIYPHQNHQKNECGHAQDAGPLLSTRSPLGMPVSAAVMMVAVRAVVVVLLRAIGFRVDDWVVHVVSQGKYLWFTEAVE